MGFSSYINERTQYFTVRDWVFKAINNWSSKQESRIFLLVGGPGTGKTAILRNWPKSRAVENQR